MRPRLVIAVIISLALASCGDSPTTTTKTSDPKINTGLGADSPGFSSGNPPAGFDVSLNTYIRKKWSVPPPPGTTIPIDAALREYRLKQRDVDWIIASFSITPERNQQGIDFAGPYMKSDQALLVRADDQRFTDVASLKKKHVCQVKSTTGDGIAIPGANTQTKKDSTNECVELLLGKTIDAVFNDTLILYGFIQENPGKFRIFLPGTFGQMQYYGIGLLGGHRDDCMKLNEIITGYLQDHWRADFTSYFRSLAEADSATFGDAGNFESKFKPEAGQMNRLSCKVNVEPSRPPA